MALFSGVGSLVGSILNYKSAQQSGKAQEHEFQEEMGFQKQVEAQKQKDEQQEQTQQKKEERQQLAVQQQGQREQTLTTLRNQNITQSVLNTELNDKYFHAQSQEVVRNLADKLNNTAPVPRGGSTTYFNANKKLNEQAANQTLMKMQYG